MNSFATKRIVVTLLIILGIFICVVAGYFIWDKYAVHPSYTGEPDVVQALPGTVMQLQKNAFVLRIYDSQAYGSTLLTRQVLIASSTQILLQGAHTDPAVYKAELTQHEADMEAASQIKDPATQKIFIGGHPAPDIYTYTPVTASALAVGEQVVVIANTDIRDAAGIQAQTIRIESSAPATASSTASTTAQKVSKANGIGSLLADVFDPFALIASAQTAQHQGELYWDSSNWSGNSYWCDSGYSLQSYHFNGTNAGNSTNATWVACVGQDATPPAPPTSAPTVTLNGSSSYVAQGSPVTLTWSSSGASSCTNNFNGGAGLSGSAQATPSGYTGYYELCTGPDGQQSIATFYAQTYVTQQADLISSISIPATATVGQVLTIGGYVTNQGGDTTGSFPDSFNVWYNAGAAGDSGASTFADPWQSSEPAGTSQYVSTTYQVTTPGIYYFRICGNSNTPWQGGAVVTESNYSNNCSDNGSWAKTVVKATSSTNSDLTAQNPPAITATLGANGTVALTLTGTVSNVGSQSTGVGFDNALQLCNGNCSWGIWPDKTSVNGSGLAAPALAPGASATITYPYTFTSPGTYYYGFCAHAWDNSDFPEVDQSVNAPSSTYHNGVNNNCSGGGDPASVITINPYVPPAAPTVSLSASPTSINAGQSSTITWSSGNATSCTSPSFSTSGAVSGSVQVQPTVTSNYGLSCTNANGTTPAVPVTVAVGCGGVPTPVITAAPSRTQAGESVTLTWSATNYSGTCSITGTDGYNNTASGASCSVAGGSATLPITKQTTYTITCGGVSSKVVVNVTPTIQEF